MKQEQIFENMDKSRAKSQEAHQIQWSTERLDRMYNVPASWKESMIHKKASKFGYKIGKINNDGKEQIVPVCPCCNNLVATYQIPLGYSINFHSQNQMPNLLPPESMIYFLFIKTIIKLLTIRFIICDFYIMYLSMEGRYCSNLHLSKTKKEQCSSFTLSAANLQSSEDQEKFVNIDFACILFTLASFYLLIRLDKQAKRIFDFFINNHQPPENTFVKSLKITQYVRDEKCNQFGTLSQEKVDLQTFLKTKTNQSDKDAINNIVSVNLSFNPTILEVIQKQRSLHKDSKEIQLQINKNYLQVCKYFTSSKDSIFYLTNFTGKLTFTQAISSKNKENYFEFYQQRTKKYFNNRIDTQVNRLYPIQVDWHQLSEVLVSGKINKSLLVMLIFLTFMTLLGLQKWKLTEKEHGQSGINAHVFLIISVITTFVVNKSLAGFILHLANKEKYKTVRQKKLDLFYSTFASQFSIVVLLSGIIYFIYPTDKLADRGLILKMLGVVGVNGVLGNLLGFFIPVAIERCKSCFEGGGSLQGFQKDANKTLELPQFLYWQRYLFYIIHTILAGFYSILIPMATPILVVVFIGQYWIDKYNLFRRSSISHQTAECLSFLYQACYRLLYFAVLSYSISHYAWGNEINYDQTIYIRLLKCFNMLLSFCFLIYFYKRDKNQQRFDQPSSENTIKERYEQNPYFYYKHQNLIVKTYENQNPITFCRKHKIIRNLPYMGVETIESQNGNFIAEEQFDKYLNLSSDKMLFPVWNFMQNKFVWIAETDLKEDFDHQKYLGLDKQGKKIINK